jgi:hypothetical protein
MEQIGQKRGERVVMQYTRWVKEEIRSTWARLVAQMRQDVGGIWTEYKGRLVAGVYLGGVDGVVVSSLEEDDVESSSPSPPSDIFVS